MKVEIVKDSISVNGDRVTTFQLTYHRYIHSEFMTHRVFSRNASSSRAIPVSTQINNLKNELVYPTHWGLNEPGMQANREGDVGKGRALWEKAANSSIKIAEEMWADGKGYHKQIVNRLIEPFSNICVVCTATDFENFFWLRNHKDAQPEIRKLAEQMVDLYRNSKPQVLYEGEWHLPYVENFRDNEGLLHYCDDNADMLYTLEEAKMISASCCAQVSYRKNDTSLDKALMVYQRLVESEPLHASPFEHPCTPFNDIEYNARNEAKELLVDKLKHMYNDDMVDNLSDQLLYCGNLRGWTQYRKFLKNENIKRRV